MNEVLVAMGEHPIAFVFLWLAVITIVGAHGK